MSAPRTIIGSYKSSTDEVDVHPTFTDDEIFKWFEEVIDPVEAEEADDEASQFAFESMFEECFDNGGKKSPFFSKGGLVFWRPNPNYDYEGHYQGINLVLQSLQIELDANDMTRYWITPYTTTDENGEVSTKDKLTTWGAITKEKLDAYKDSDDFRESIKDLVSENRDGCIHYDISTHKFEEEKQEAAPASSSSE